MSTLAPTLEAFFTERLIAQRQASPHTVAAYRDTFRILLTLCAAPNGQVPRLRCASGASTHRSSDSFLDHLETERGNDPRTRNARLAAIHSLFRFAALRHPEHAALIERVLAIPPKRFERAPCLVPHRRRGRRADRRTETATLVGRHDHALLPPCDPDRPPGLRAGRLSQKETWYSGPALTCAATGEGPKGADHAVDPGNGEGPGGMAG